MSIEQSLYQVLDLIPEHDRKQAMTLLLPHFNIISRKICVRMHQKMNAELNDDTAVFNMICDCVSQLTGVLDVANTRTRKHECKLSRHMVMFCMVHELVNEGMMSLTSVGKLFKGSPAHSSVIYAEKNIANLYATDLETFNMMNQIADCLSSKGYTRTQIKLQSIKTYVKRQSI